jgi:hypothetical protein
MHNTLIQKADALCLARVTSSAPCEAHLPLSLCLLSAAITVWQQLQDDICWFASTLQQRTNVPCKTANNTGLDWKSANTIICVTECCQRLTTGQQKDGLTSRSSRQHNTQGAPAQSPEASAMSARVSSAACSALKTVKVPWSSAMRALRR